MSDVVYDDGTWSLRREEAPLPDGRVKKGVRVYRCDSVHVLAFASPTTVLMLREFRPFHGKYQWMLPSGKVDKETDLLEAAQRELREETGMSASKLTYVMSCQNTDLIAIKNHLFIAEDLTKSPLPQDETELIEVHELSLQEALKNVLGCSPIHTMSAFALTWYVSTQQK